MSKDLLQIIESHERLESEIKELKEEQRDLMKDAKFMGFLMKPIRRIMKERKMDIAVAEEHEHDYVQLAAQLAHSHLSWTDTPLGAQGDKGTPEQTPEIKAKFEKWLKHEQIKTDMLAKMGKEYADEDAAELAQAKTDEFNSGFVDGTIKLKPKKQTKAQIKREEKAVEFDKNFAKEAAQIKADKVEDEAEYKVSKQLAEAKMNEVMNRISLNQTVEDEASNTLIDDPEPLTADDIANGIKYKQIANPAGVDINGPDGPSAAEIEEAKISCDAIMSEQKAKAKPQTKAQKEWNEDHEAMLSKAESDMNAIAVSANLPANETAELQKIIDRELKNDDAASQNIASSTPKKVQNGVGHPEKTAKKSKTVTQKIDKTDKINVGIDVGIDA